MVQFQQLQPVYDGHHSAANIDDITLDSLELKKWLGITIEFHQS